MIGPVIPTGANAPHVGAEDQHGYEEEYSNHFQPKCAAHMGEGAQESGYAAGQTAAGAAGDLTGLTGRGAAGGNRLSGVDLAAGVGVSGNALAGDSAGNPHSDAENPAYGFGSHPCL